MKNPHPMSIKVTMLPTPATYKLKLQQMNDDEQQRKLSFEGA